VRENASNAIGGPFLISALFCERVLEEKDGVQSLMRIVDGYNVDPDMLPRNNGEAFFHTNVVAILKSGDYTGTAKVEMRMRFASGDVGPALTTDVDFKGGRQGVSLVVGLAIPATEQGQHWLDVEVNGQLLTRTPLQLELRSASSSATN
jgi:hypothetical protein